MSQQSPTTPASRATVQEAALSNGARTPDQIEADLAATRDRLATTIDALVDRVHPKALALRGVENARASVLDESGRPRTARIVKVAVGVGGGVAALVLLGRLVRRRRR